MTGDVVVVTLAVQGAREQGDLGLRREDGHEVRAFIGSPMFFRTVWTMRASSGAGGHSNVPAMAEPEAAPALDERPDELALWPLVEAHAAATPDALMAVDADGRRLTFARRTTTAASGWPPPCTPTACAPAPSSRGSCPPTRRSCSPVRSPASGPCRFRSSPSSGRREVGFILEQTGASHVVAPGVWRGFDYPVMVRATLGARTSTVDLLVADPDLPEADPAALPAHEPVDERTVRWVFYTSGTTANPKGHATPIGRSPPAAPDEPALRRDPRRPQRARVPGHAHRWHRLPHGRLHGGLRAHPRRGLRPGGLLCVAHAKASPSPARARCSG